MRNSYTHQEKLWKYLLKLLIPLTISLVFFAYVSFAVIIPKISEHLIDCKHETLKSLITVATDVLGHSYEMEQSGKLKRAEAQKQALELIRDFKYGIDMRDYFWVTDADGIMLMHPYFAKLENTNTLDLQDNNGKYLIREFIETAKKYGAGYVYYSWPHYEQENKIVPKLSYVAMFQPWNWVIGTGVYIEDVKENINEFEKIINVFFFVLIAVSLIISFYLVNENIKSRKRQMQIESSFWDVFYTSKNPKLIMDGDKFVECNDMAVRILGYKNKEEILSKHPSQISPEFQPDGRSSYEKANELISLLKKNGFSQFEWVHTKADGEIFPVIVTLTLLIVGGRQLQHVVWKDLSEEKKIEKEKEEMSNHLIQVAKLTSLGTLAASVAHELNNPLTVLLGYMEILKTNFTGVEHSREVLDKCLRACERMNKIIDRMRTFARNSKKEDWVLTSLNTVIENTLIIMEPKIKKSGVSLSLVLNDKIEKIWGETTQLESIFQNFISNSLDAFEGIKDERKKEIIITTMREYNGKTIVVVYQDNASGMTKEVIEHIFDPFFTTKGIGKGTGLGMSIAHEIIEKHKASIQLESEEGIGTKFVISFPIDRRQGAETI